MIDFHSHVLPGVDDGSKSMEQSLQMLEASVQQGVTHMVATPHFYASRMDPDSFLDPERQPDPIEKRDPDEKGEQLPDVEGSVQRNIVRGNDGHGLTSSLMG